MHSLVCTTINNKDWQTLQRNYALWISETPPKNATTISDKHVDKLLPEIYDF